MQAHKNGGTMSNKELSRLLKEAVDSMDQGGEESSGWAAPKDKAGPAPFLGVAIPIKVETPNGSLRCYLSLPPEVASSPEAFLGAIRKLIDMGFPVDLYQPKQDGGWNRNGGGGGGGGGWNNGGGNGYRSGGGYNNGGGSGGYRRGGSW